MMQKRRFKALAMVLALGIVAAGCGGDDDDATGSDDDGDGGDTPEEVTGPPSVTLDEECEAAKADGVAAPEGFRVNLVTDIGRVDDGTFNQFAFEAMEAAAECFGFETSYIETVSEADYATNISTSLGANPNVLITNGFLIATDTLAAAQAHPDVDFIGVDQFQEEFPANYVGVLFREDQGGYMAGVLAASLSETGVVGVVGGREDVPPVVRFVNAFEAGAKSVNPDIQVLSVYNESFTAPDKGASDAAQFIGEGADVIFGAGGQTGSGAIAAAAEQGKWAIGVDQDEYFTTFNSGDTPGADRLATSAVKRVDLAVFRNIVASLKDEFEGGLYTLEAENDGITYAPFHDAELPEEAIAALEEARKGLADGSVDTGVDPVTGLPN
jgi:basic membrane protein A and related proteins